jgi:glucose/arabinose dehydrogenase
VTRRRSLLLLAAVAVVAVALGAVVLLRDDDEPVDDTAACGEPSIEAPEVPDELDAGPAVAFEPAGFEGEYVTAMAPHPDGRLFFLTREGRLVQRRGDSDEELLDLQPAIENERGALGLTVAPDGLALYLTYTPDDVTNVLVELPVTADGVDPAGQRELLRVRNERGQHMMNQVVFGPDGHLYVGLGDTGVDRIDPDGTQVAQDRAELLGKILRIDPAPSGDRPYSVPDDNPFAGDATAAPEVFALGMRNPWRFSFDPATGDLWITDVGELCGEEITRLAPDDAPGANLGWSTYEATYRLDGAPEIDGAVPPTLWYRRATSGPVVRCAGIGGFVYDGSAIEGLQGHYLFGDLCDRTLMAADASADSPRVVSLGLREVGGQLLALAADGDGEPYVLTTDGAFRLVPG